jgi:hypothetical protein
MSNRMTRTHKRETLVHVNFYITRRAFAYFDKQPNMSAAMREVLDNYAAKHTEDKQDEVDSK